MAEYQVVDKAAHDAELQSIGDSIRAKGGTTEPFNSAAEMKAAVDAIKTGGPPPVIQLLEVTENGEYTAPDGVDGYSPVSVNVQGAVDKNEAYKNLILRVQHKVYDVLVTDKTDIGDSAFWRDGTIGSFTGKDIGTIYASAFYYAKSLKEFKAEKIGSIYFNSFWMSAITRFDAKSITDIGTSAFKQSKLDTLIIRTGLTTIQNNTLDSTPIASGTGYIYVPKALVEQYKVATNWVKYADQIRAIEDYPEITGG